MQASERRTSRRYIKRVRLRFRPTMPPSIPVQEVESMNISTGGVYFATDVKMREGLLVEVQLKMPQEIIGDEVTEWRYTGRSLT